MDPTITKASTGKERLVAACAESQSTSRGPNRTRFLAVQVTIRAKMQCDKKCLLEAADASKKRNLMAVGGQADNDVDLCEEDNVDTKRSVKLFQRGRERLPGCVERTDAPVYMCCECCTFCCLLLMDKARAKDKIYI